jgi:SSS family solute:Na+ symporter
MNWLGLSILPAYFVAILLVGWFTRRKSRSANDYLNASRALPLWIVSIAFLAVNCGALEVLGLSAMAAEFGVQAFQFYWIGAIPGIVFLALWMMPVYFKSDIRSIPDFLRLRYGEGVQIVNATSHALLMVMLAGISLYAMGQTLHAIFGLHFAVSITLTSVVVSTYVLLGGLRATIYNEVLQLIVMLIGLLPLFVQTYRSGLVASRTAGMVGHLWTAMPNASNASAFDKVGTVIGLGFVLGFSYWGTDFVLIQRALASRTSREARMVPILAGLGKLAFSFLVVLPGLASRTLVPHIGTTVRFDEALPSLMRTFYGPVMLGFGLTALASSLLSSLAANLSGFTAVWTQDIYRKWLRPDRNERHYKVMGYWATVFAIFSSMAFSSVSYYFTNLMEHIQLLFSLFSAPFLAIFLLGMISKRITARGVLIGFISGMVASACHEMLILIHYLHYGGIMNANFHGAIYGFAFAALPAWVFRRRSPLDSFRASPLQLRWGTLFAGEAASEIALIASVLLIACGLLNFVWR